MERYGGAIVADSVGMGKTYVALQLIHRALDEGATTLVVVPPTLRAKWRRVLCMAGMEPRPHRENARVKEATVSIVSHALVHRVARPTAPLLVVVDEAHQFRNPRTARYRALARITAHASVVLLTATPINNRPADLYWLLRMFLGDGALRDAGVPDLRVMLANDTDRHALIRRAVDAVVIRRTRADLTLAADSTAALRFPRQHPPKPVPYDLRSVHPTLIDGLEDTFAALRLSAFDVSRTSARPSSRAHASALVRIGLLKRLESSSAAFRASIVRLIRFLDAFDDALGCGGYLRPRDTRGVDPLQLSLTGLLAQPLPRGVDASRLAEDVASDRRLLRRLLGQMSAQAVCAKTAALHALLAQLGTEPRVVFTEYAETAEAIFATLPRAGVALLHGTRAAMASGPASRRAILDAFSPQSGPADKAQRLIRIDTLITTDLLAEGVDLHAARHCISYDLPWNPVRLMQRAGRIDRLGSPHPDVFVWYFEPNAVVDRLLRLMPRLGAKVRTITRTIGAEHGAAGLAQADAPAAVPEASGSGLSQILAGAETAPPDPGANCIAGSVVAVRNRPVARQRFLILAWRRGSTRWADGWSLGRDRARLLPRGTVERLLVDVHAQISGGAAPQDAEVAGAVSVVTLEEAIGLVQCDQTRPGPAAGGAVRSAADALRHALARHPGGPDLSLCRRADRILQRLERGLPAGTAQLLDVALEHHASTGAATLCNGLESVLGARRHPPARLFAALLIEGASG